MADDQKRIAVAFYRTNSGREPIRQWLKELDPDNDKVMLDTLNRAAAIVGKRLKIELVENAR